jgi:surfeit locus 1 family protein
MSIGANGRGGLVFWGTVMAALAVLIGLGTWQMQRRAWKLGLIERIESRAHGEPISLSLAKQHWAKERDVEYYRVLLVGRFLHDEERHLFTVEEGTAGWRIVTPLATAGGDLVLVDRGFVPEPLKDPATRQAGQTPGAVELIGLARAPATPGWFTPAGDLVRNQWFARDVPGMAASLPARDGSRVVPFMVEAEAQNVPGGWPRGGITRLTVTNRHLEYALTWYGLAVTLIVIAVVMTRSRSREAARQL